MEGAADGDHTAAGQVNAAFGFADFRVPFKRLILFFKSRQT